MTSFKERTKTAPDDATTDAAERTDSEKKLTLAEILELLAGGTLPLRFTAYDGSSAGPPDAPFGLELTSPRGTTYLATARGDLGLARAYIAGELTNTPENVVRWIMDPQAIEPGTVMPDLGLTEAEARDVAAHLYGGQ